jgi:hypothetical protein
LAEARTASSADGAVGLDLEHQLVQIGALLDAGAFDGVAHALDRRERSIQHDAAERAWRLVVVAAQAAGHVATALFHLDLHVQLGAGRQGGNHVVGVDDLDVVRRLDVGRGDHAFAVLAQAQRDFVAVVELEHHALEVQQHVDDVFLDAVDGRVLVHHASNGDFGRRMTHHGRQQHAAQGVAQRVTVAALERLQRDLGAVGRELARR